MATSTTHMSRVARPARKLEKLRPLKVSQNRHSLIDPRLGTLEEIMNLADIVASNLVNGNYDHALPTNVKSLHSVMKACGSKLETIYKDQLDRAFVSFRNGCRDDSLDYVSRLCLLELIELRATQWAPHDIHSYYKYKLNHPDVDSIVPPSCDIAFLNSPVLFPASPTAATPAPLLLGPGELLKSSGKYPAPTKVLGKNYCKDEVVIRNSDSGKVMGIKGRRVHMIEELSETVISFQRVNPGAKERLVQITGPTEDKITYAKQLMEETIRRNASPVRADGDGDRLGSSSSLNSSTSDDSMMPVTPTSKRATLLHSYSTNDATLGEYKYTVTVGNDTIKVTGANLDLVRIAKLVLDEYFSPDMCEDVAEQDDCQDVFEQVAPFPQVIVETSVDKEDSPVPLVVERKRSKSPAAKDVGPYTWNYMVRLVDSPFSILLPDTWPRVIQEFPSILKKTPIERLTAASLFAARLREVTPPIQENQ